MTSIPVLGLLVLLGVLWSARKAAKRASEIDRSSNLRLLQFGLYGFAASSVASQFPETLPAQALGILATAFCARAMMHAGMHEKWVSRIGIVSALFFVVFAEISAPEAGSEMAGALRLLTNVANGLLIGSSLGHFLCGANKNWRWVGMGWMLVVAFAYSPALALCSLSGFVVILEGLRRWTAPAQLAENVRNAS